MLFKTNYLKSSISLFILIYFNFQLPFLLAVSISQAQVAEQSVITYGFVADLLLYCFPPPNYVISKNEDDCPWYEVANSYKNMNDILRKTIEIKSQKEWIKNAKFAVTTFKKTKDNPILSKHRYIHLAIYAYKKKFEQLEEKLNEVETDFKQKQNQRTETTKPSIGNKHDQEIEQIKIIKKEQKEAIFEDLMNNALYFDILLNCFVVRPNLRSIKYVLNDQCFLFETEGKLYLRKKKFFYNILFLNNFKKWKEKCDNVLKTFQNYKVTVIPQVEDDTQIMQWVYDNQNKYTTLHEKMMAYEKCIKAENSDACVLNLLPLANNSETTLNLRRLLAYSLLAENLHKCYKQFPTITYQPKKCLMEEMHFEANRNPMMRVLLFKVMNNDDHENEWKRLAQIIVKFYDKEKLKETYGENLYKHKKVLRKAEKSIEFLRLRLSMFDKTTNNDELSNRTGLPIQ